MKPMLCEKATLDEVRKLDDQWVIEPKYDGVRAYIENGQLFDRRGKNITKQFPEFNPCKTGKVFDGEIVAQSGVFEDVSGRMHLRDKLKIMLAAKKYPAKLILFDCVTEAALVERREHVVDFVERCKERGEGNIDIGEQFPMSRLELCWQDVLDNNREGVVCKHKAALYQEGKRSRYWLKVKAFVETTAIFTRYEVHPRGITIETREGNRVVVNGRQSESVKKAIDENGSVVCEIQYLPQASGEWRFPSFRGVKDER